MRVVRPELFAVYEDSVSEESTASSEETEGPPGKRSESLERCLDYSITNTSAVRKFAAVTTRNRQHNTGRRAGDVEYVVRRPGDVKASIARALDEDITIRVIRPSEPESTHEQVAFRVRSAPKEWPRYRSHENRIHHYEMPEFEELYDADNEEEKENDYEKDEQCPCLGVEEGEGREEMEDGKGEESGQPVVEEVVYGTEQGKHSRVDAEGGEDRKEIEDEKREESKQPAPVKRVRLSDVVYAKWANDLGVGFILEMGLDRYEIMEIVDRLKEESEKRRQQYEEECQQRWRQRWYPRTVLGSDHKGTNEEKMSEGEVREEMEDGKGEESGQAVVEEVVYNSEQDKHSRVDAEEGEGREGTEDEKGEENEQAAPVKKLVCVNDVFWPHRLRELGVADEVVKGLSRYQIKEMVLQLEIEREKKMEQEAMEQPSPCRHEWRKKIRQLMRPSYKGMSEEKNSEGNDSSECSCDDRRDSRIGPSSALTEEKLACQNKRMKNFGRLLMRADYTVPSEVKSPEGNDSSDHSNSSDSSGDDSDSSSRSELQTVRQQLAIDYKFTSEEESSESDSSDASSKCSSEDSRDSGSRTDDSSDYSNDSDSDEDDSDHSSDDRSSASTETSSGDSWSSEQSGRTESSDKDEEDEENSSSSDYETSSTDRTTATSLQSETDDSGDYRFARLLAPMVRHYEVETSDEDEEDSVMSEDDVCSSEYDEDEDEEVSEEEEDISWEDNRRRDDFTTDEEEEEVDDEDMESEEYTLSEQMDSDEEETSSRSARHQQSSSPATYSTPSNATRRIRNASSSEVDESEEDEEQSSSRDNASVHSRSRRRRARGHVTTSEEDEEAEESDDESSGGTESGNRRARRHPVSSSDDDEEDEDEEEASDDEPSEQTEHVNRALRHLASTIYDEEEEEDEEVSEDGEVYESGRESEEGGQKVSTAILGACTICHEEDIEEPTICGNCKGVVGCWTCVTRWSRAADYPQCPLCRTRWSDRKEDAIQVRMMH